jgi:two-component system response regulator DevR
MSRRIALPTMKVFLVEDSPLIRDRIKAMLTSIDGVQVVGEAEAPAQALVGIEASEPDAVILDLQLTGGSGLFVLREMKTFAPDIAVIVLTNYVFPQFRSQCLEAGAKDFFDKSTEFDKARNTIAQMSRQQSARHA